MHLEHQSLKSILSVYTLNTFLGIRADPNMQVFWVSISDSGSLSDTFLMFFDVFIIIIIIIIIYFWTVERNFWILEADSFLLKWNVFNSNKFFLV